MSAAPRKPPLIKPATPRRGPSSLQIMFVAVLALGLILAINFSSRIAAGQPLQQTYDEVLAELESLRAEQAALIAERDYVRGDAYVERWARSEGKLIRPGEVLFIPVAASVTDAAPEEDPLFVEVETRAPEPDPWMVWWQLFFDVPPPEF